MRIGYPCINRGIGCTPNSTFRLSSYSEKNLVEHVENNLGCLEKILKFNLKNDFLFFRIGSDIIPFASHPVCKFNWQKYFEDQFKSIGKFIKRHGMRISMHPDQFVLLNALNKRIVQKSIRELEYHCDVLDLLELDESAKIQIHVGGIYGDKKSAIERFCKVYRGLPAQLKKRLVIENDDRFCLNDCLFINQEIKIPTVFDTLHHELFNRGESFKDAIKKAMKTWRKKDGVLMVDYSTQATSHRKGTHSSKINIAKFKGFIAEVKDFDFDIMLEIKDKERSAGKAVKVLQLLNLLYYCPKC